ncbi:MAG: iron ABC transporter permease [Chloroflexi bacterium]|nr:iron ABC transporter permease [Chloroflexota bacterium]
MKSGSRLAMIALLLFVAFLVVYPLVMLMFGSLRGGAPWDKLPFSIAGYQKAYSDLGTYEILATTIWLGLARTVLSLALAIFLAWVVTRTDTPLKRFLEVTVWVQFFVPYLPVILAWVLLASPRTGLINTFASGVFGLEKPLFDIFSYGGIIWVSVIHQAAIIFILVTPAFRGMDASLEESSRVLGASRFATLRFITLPILKPAILAASMLAFIRLMESFETELILGYSKGIFVYTTRIYQLIFESPTDFPFGMALSSVFLIIIFALVLTQWRVLGRRQYVTVTGRGFAQRPTSLGRWKYLTLALVLFYFAVGVVLPLFALIMGSFMRIFGVALEDPFTLRHWQNTLKDPLFWPSIKNSLYIGLGSATVGMFLYAFISYLITKTKLMGRQTLEILTWLPWGVPSVVLALGFLWAYVGGIPLPFSLYGTIWLIMLVMMVKGFPLGVRVMNGAMVQVSPELEESARVLGGSWLHSFRRILMPLVSPAFVSAWIVLFLLGIRELSTVLFLYSDASRPMSVLMFEYWNAGGYAEQGLVVGLIQTVIVLSFAIAARALGYRRDM